MLFIDFFVSIVRVLFRCANTRRIQFERPKSSGGSGEGTSALEGNCRSSHPAAP